MPMTRRVWPDGSRWVFVLSVPWLTHRPSPHGAGDLQAFFADQVVFLSAFATNAVFSSPGSLLQLRYSVPEGGNRALRCAVVGAASTEAEARELLDFVYSALPRGLPLEVVGEALGRETLRPEALAALSLAEVRRAVLPVPRRLLRRDPAESSAHDAGNEAATVGGDGGGEGNGAAHASERGDHVSRRRMLIPWQWTHSSLESTLSAMSRQRRASFLAVTVSPAPFTTEDRRAIARSLRALAAIVEGDRGNVLADALLVQYLAYQREMHAGCLCVRVVVGHDHDGGRFLAHVAGSDLASGGLNVPGMAAFDVRTPRTEEDHCSLLDVVTLGPGARPDEGARSDGLITKFPALEANVAFRFPVFAKDLVVADW